MPNPLILPTIPVVPDVVVPPTFPWEEFPETIEFVIICPTVNCPTSALLKSNPFTGCPFTSAAWALVSWLFPSETAPKTFFIPSFAL